VSTCEPSLSLPFRLPAWDRGAVRVLAGFLHGGKRIISGRAPARPAAQHSFHTLAWPCPCPAGPCTGCLGTCDRRDGTPRGGVAYRIHIWAHGAKYAFKVLRCWQTSGIHILDCISLPFAEPGIPHSAPMCSGGCHSNSALVNGRPGRGTDDAGWASLTLGANAFGWGCSGLL
jgi:hypothetical protein